MAEHRTSVLVLGIGNVLLQDDAAGVRVVEALQRLGLGRDVEYLDGGTAGIDLLDAIADRDLLVAVDAVQAGLEPGTVHRLEPEDLEPGGPASSLHQAGLHDLLAVARLLGCSPRRTVVVGVEPATLDFGLQLSEPVHRALPLVVATVLAAVAGR